MLKIRYFKHYFYQIRRRTISFLSSTTSFFGGHLYIPKKPHPGSKTVVVSDVTEDDPDPLVSELLLWLLEDVPDVEVLDV